MKLLSFIIAIAPTVSCFADSKTDDLSTRLAVTEAARIIAVHDKALLNAQVTALTAVNAELSKRLAAVVEAENKTPGAVAVAKAQVESTQTLANTDSSVKAQTEFEKQLARVETDVKATVVAQRNEMYLLVLMTVLMLCFVGFVIYSNRALVRHDFENTFKENKRDEA